MTAPATPSRPRATQVAPDDGFAELRRIFHSRESGERAYLTRLQATLARAHRQIGSTLEEMRARTHRLRGGAGVLGISKLTAAAKALERALEAAAGIQPGKVSLRVGRTLEALIRLLDGRASAPKVRRQAPQTRVRENTP